MKKKLHPKLEKITSNIIARSAVSRAAYLARMQEAGAQGSGRKMASCGNLAHAIAAVSPADKKTVLQENKAHIAIVSSYNDMLSAHQPFAAYPDIIKTALRETGATAQVAGGVPAMCDGVTQGQPGMELSLFSRDVIAMSTAIALSHNVFDGAICLGVCDKIIPGLVIGALSFGHLPVIFAPAGPMPSGLPNPEKARVRQLFAQGKADKDDLLKAESKSYHSAGTCTFYGTANSNQMLMEFMGLHLPGAAFVQPKDPLRDQLTAAAAKRLAEPDCPALSEIIDERTIVNAIVGLHATGGSTNHTIHLVAMARTAGIVVDWQDFEELAGITPLLARIYPNGPADVNHFQDAGGLALVIRELLDNGLLHEDVTTIAGESLRAYAEIPAMNEDGLYWQQASKNSRDETIVRPLARPFAADGGLRMVKGNLGKAVIKVSAVKPEHRFVRAPARVFSDQDELIEAFQREDLNMDFVAVLRFNGPRANGMPELHKLTPVFGALQDKGFSVALVTDGRMSGASGKIPAAIHVSPEAALNGPIGKVQDGDIIVLDALNGLLEVEVSASHLQSRTQAVCENRSNNYGTGRELFAGFRKLAQPAELGALSIPDLWEDQT